MDQHIIEKIIGVKDNNEFKEIIEPLNNIQKNLFIHLFVYSYSVDELPMIFSMSKKDVDFQINDAIAQLKQRNGV